MTVVALIVAGGSGERLGREGGKQMLEIAGRPVLARTVDAFERSTSVDAIVVVAHPDRVAEYRTGAVDVVGSRKVIAVVPGGASRQESVSCGLGALPDDADVVLVHDGARPAVTPELVDGVVRTLTENGELDGVVVGHPVYDTLKLVDESGMVVGTADRSAFWAAQTPQVFRADVLRGAYTRAAALGETGTDDAALVERASGRVAMYLGPRTNLKVTVAEDVAMLTSVLDAGETRGTDG